MLQADATRPVCVDSRRKMEGNDECRWGRKEGDAHIGGCEDSGSRISRQKGSRRMFDTTHDAATVTK